MIMDQNIAGQQHQYDAQNNNVNANSNNINTTNNNNTLKGETGDKQRVAVVDRGEAHLVPPKAIQGISDPPTVINTWIM